MSRKSSTETLVAAMRILARDIQSGDGVANAAIAEAADRLEELHADHLRDATKMAEQQARIAELEQQAAIGRRAVDAWDALAALVGEIDGLIDESGGVYGLHLNGAPAPWSQILEGGHFECLCSLSDARRLLAGMGVES